MTHIIITHKCTKYINTFEFSKKYQLVFFLCHFFKKIMVKITKKTSKTRSCYDFKTYLLWLRFIKWYFRLILYTEKKTWIFSFFCWFSVHKRNIWRNPISKLKCSKIWEDTISQPLGAKKKKKKIFGKKHLTEKEIPYRKFDK